MNADMQKFVEQFNDWRNLISEEELTLITVIATTPSVASARTERGLYARIVNSKQGGRFVRVDIPLDGGSVAPNDDDE